MKAAHVLVAPDSAISLVDSVTESALSIRKPSLYTNRNIPDDVLSPGKVETGALSGRVPDPEKGANSEANARGVRSELQTNKQTNNTKQCIFVFYSFSIMCYNFVICGLFWYANFCVRSNRIESADSVTESTNEIAESGATNTSAFM